MRNMEEIIEYKGLKVTLDLHPALINCDPILANILFTNPPKRVLIVALFSATTVPLVSKEVVDACCGFIVVTSRGEFLVFVSF